ncbi:MAG TPA: ribonuclease J [Nitrospiria bacterium]|jgi:ribonuclease J
MTQLSNNLTPSQDLPLKIIPLGGIGEIGLNMTLFQWGEDILVVDCGLMFPDAEMLGVDIMIPDMRYIQENRQKIRGLVLTHGHEDHIGAIPYFLREVNPPIYGTPLTLGLVAEKFREHELPEDPKLFPIQPKDTVQLGAFTVEFIQVTHSIVGGVGLGITTPVGRVVHTGDFKIDHTPVDGKVPDLSTFGEYGRKGTLALLSDSTNAERKGFTPSESEVGKAFQDVFAQAPGRIIIATFASNIHRIQQAVNAAVRTNRKVCLNGKSMVNNAAIALQLGYLHIPKDVWLEMDDIQNLPDQQVVLITTGSQGEPMSSLFRMSTGEHKQFQVHDGDTIILSSRVIPGNERAIGRVINNLFRQGAKVIYERVSDIHVSGHASQEELKLMINLVKPTFFIPVHGEYRHLVHHSILAEQLQIPKDRIFILEDGDILELTKDKGMRIGQVPAGRIYIAGKGQGPMDEVTIKDRQRLGRDGLLIVLLRVNKKTWELTHTPELFSMGFMSEEESPEVLEDLKRHIRETFESVIEELKEDENALKTRIRNSLRKFLFKNLERRPIVIPILLDQ